MFGLCHAPDVMWVAPVQSWRIRIVTHPRGSTSPAACSLEIFTARSLQNHGFTHDTKQEWIFLCTERTDLTHISCYCMNILISSKWLYTAWCNLQGMCCKCLNCMFINAFSSGSMSKAFRSCKVLQLISFSDQQQTTQGEICSLWTWLLIFVEQCTLFLPLGKVMRSVFLCVLESLSLDFPKGAFLTRRFSLCSLLMLTPDYIFLI